MVNYYRERLAQYGDDVKALGWSSEESQHARFKVLMEIRDLRYGTVLDWGCGFGDLSAYLDPLVNYMGYDPDPQMLERARAKYPQAHFFDHPMQADYILESGAFNLTRDWWPDVETMWALCRKGMALNFTSSLAERQTPGIVYADPFTTVRACAALTKKFVLRHDYRQNDFTVYLYK